MNTEPIPEAEDELLLSTPHKTPPPAKPIIILLGISATLLLGVTYMLIDSQTPAKQPAAASEEPPRAPKLAGKSEIQLRADLVRVKQELDRAKAEREKTLKAIEQVSQELDQRLKEANLADDDR